VLSFGESTTDADQAFDCAAANQSYPERIAVLSILPSSRLSGVDTHCRHRDFLFIKMFPRLPLLLIIVVLFSPNQQQQLLDDDSMIEANMYVKHIKFQ
jgi:hypothetical protein